MEHIVLILIYLLLALCLAYNVWRLETLQKEVGTKAKLLPMLSSLVQMCLVVALAVETLPHLEALRIIYQ